MMTKQEILDLNLEDLDKTELNNLISDINTFSDDDKEEIILNIIDHHRDAPNNSKLVVGSFASVVQRYKYNRGKPFREQKEQKEQEEKAFNRELNLALLDTYSKEEILNLDLNKTISLRIESKVLLFSIKEMSEEDALDVVESIIDSFFPPSYLKTIDEDLLRQFHIKESMEVIGEHRTKLKELNEILNFLNNNSVIDLDQLLTEIYQKHKEYFIIINRLFNNRIAHIDGTVKQK